MAPQPDQSLNESSLPPTRDPLEEAEELLRILSNPELELQTFGQEAYDRRSKRMLAALTQPRDEKPSLSLQRREWRAFI